MSLSFLPRLAAALALGFLASCGSIPPSGEPAGGILRENTLENAERLMSRAKRIKAPSEAAVYQLRAAEIAWNHLDTDGGDIRDMRQLTETQQHALRVITLATEEVSLNFIGANYQPEKQFNHAGYSYRVSAAIARKPGVRPLAELESAIPAREVRHRLCRNWHAEDGVGAPCAPKWKRPADSAMRRFVSSRSYQEPLTAVLAFDGPNRKGTRSASLTGYDPTRISRVKLGSTGYPLAADFTAPIVAQIADINEFQIAITGLVHPGGLDSKLILLEPYDPDRIPVILIHGLNSHPRMWKDVLNDLRADPKLRGRYQFMLFYYPTGWPIVYSSMRLRQELTALESLVGPPKKMVLIGHSMGGLLSRLQVISPDRKIWDAQYGADADRLYQKLPAGHLARRVALFSANPNIGREIYICTPHRGSRLADLSLTSLLIKVLSIPTKITTALIDLPSNLHERGQLTSIGGLSTRNRLYQALDQIPIQVPHHSIIGNFGMGNWPGRTDGVVPYWSAHLDSAQSELVVPGHHGAFDHPKAIQEMRRILLLNAGIRD
jgi:pimeloyl-ACP methyl ester carboxylesterase